MSHKLFLSAQNCFRQRFQTSASTILSLLTISLIRQKFLQQHQGFTQNQQQSLSGRLASLQALQQAGELLAPALAVSAILFSLGVAGVLLRRNAIVVFMCIELMLNAVNLTFVALAQQLGYDGQVVVFFVMAVAAAEAAVGLAIIIAIYRHRQTVNLDKVNLLSG